MPEIKLPFTFKLTHEQKGRIADAKRWIKTPEARALLREARDQAELAIQALHKENAKKYRIMHHFPDFLRHGRA